MNREKLIAVFRIVLGLAQMTMAAVALGLYLQMGANRWSLGALGVTLLLVLSSRITFPQKNNTNFLTMKKYGSELIGTFCLVFAGTGAIIINDVSGGAISHAGIALTFGLVVMAMIYTFGDISGAHFNPAVTLGFFAARRLPAREVLPYVGSQVLGAAGASGLLRLLFPQHQTLGVTLPAGAAAQSFVLEVILTSILMLVIFSVSIGAKEKGITAGIAIGGVIALEAMFAGAICGASMNPARSLAPALVSTHFEHLWIYVAAPILGSLLAVPACCAVRERGCCSASTPQTEPVA